MNTNALKKFARESRKKLISQVESKLNYILSADTIELRAKEKQLNEIREQVSTLGKDNFVEKIAYTWFNRFTALRFMDLHNYTFIKIVSPPDGFTLPEILSEAKNGHIDDRLKVDKERLNKILDGIIPSQNPQSDVYKTLFIAACNYYNSMLPFMFERIEDYTELLLPDDLLSENSVLMNVVKNLTKEDCEDVEIIGWLYQFYISEKNEEVNKKLDKNIKIAEEDIPAATQFFTPDWIVRYLVDNSLGKLWILNHPNSKLKENLKYYTETELSNTDVIKVSSPEEIKFLDPASGSAHILVYAFELLTKIYEEEGYDKPDIPKLIIEKNLYGLEIDERAAALGSFALTMKAAQYHNRYLRNPLIPNIYVFENSDEFEQFKNAKTFGSLIRLKQSEFEKIKVEENSIFGEKQQLTKDIAHILLHKFDCVVTNPPYLNSSSMNNVLKKFVEKNYKNAKADLYACFIERCLEFTKENAFTSLVTMHAWMFLSSFGKPKSNFRENIIDNTFIDSMCHLGPRAFPEIGGEVVQNTAFILLKNNEVTSKKGKYIRLVDIKDPFEKEKRFYDSSRHFSANQNDFNKIPGSPIAYWVSERVRDIFEKTNRIEQYIEYTGSLHKTSDNERFLRRIWEVERKKVGRKNKWVFYNKGGIYRKWYGNNEIFIDWSSDALVHYMNHPTANLFKKEFWFREGITWTALTISNFNSRYFNDEFISDFKGAAIFPLKDIELILSYLNSLVSNYFLKILAPTMDYNIGQVVLLPYKEPPIKENIIILGKNSIIISKNEWDSRETSWDFKKNELLRLKENGKIETAYNNYCNYWREQFFQLHKNEEELNKIFIEIYGLQDELTPDVDLKDITILKQETEITEDNQLVFKKDEIVKQFISYAVGCMFGRYSLDKEGLILANQGETLEDYLKQIPNPTFMPDEDGIIPVLEDDYFVDDIVERFREFLKVTFGEENYNENLAFIEDALGKDIRKYFAKDFYADHIKRYKKRPIYWMFSSPKKSFNALIYMHRYKPDTVSKLLNDYLREFQEKLKAKKEQLTHIITSESSRPTEKNKAQKEKARIEAMELELQQYEREILYPLATKKIEIDLDDGVKVNYNKFGNALQKVAGLTE